MNGMVKPFFAVSRVLMKPGLASCTATPDFRRSAYKDSASTITPAFEAA